MLKVSGLNVNIGPTPILQGVDLAVRQGSMCGLIGRNGAGKTTFMRAVMGALPAVGKIDFAGTELTAVAPHRRAHLGIGFMPEDRRLVPELTAEENILIPVWSTAIADSQARLQRIYRLMPEVQQFRQQRANQLSGGQQKMVALGRALMCGSQFLLLDEPFEGLAPALARRLAQVLYDLKREKVSALVADSNQQHMAGLLDEVFQIERGRVAAAV